jgi:hypothetical protein
MKPTSTPHDPLDELLAAAVHGELTAAQRAELDALLQNDPAARAAYQEIQAMHDLLERNHQDAKPDPNFEDRMISGVRRKARADETRETPWESALVLWSAIKYPFMVRPSWTFATALTVLVIGLASLMQVGYVTFSAPAKRDLLLQLPKAKSEVAYNGGMFPPGSVAVNQEKALEHGVPESESIDQLTNAAAMVKNGEHSSRQAVRIFPGPTVTTQNGLVSSTDTVREYPASTSAATGFASVQATPQLAQIAATVAPAKVTVPSVVDVPATPSAPAADTADAGAPRAEPVADANSVTMSSDSDALKDAPVASTMTPDQIDASNKIRNDQKPSQVLDKSKSEKPVSAAPVDTRKLIRDAQLDLEVKSYQNAVDAVTSLAHAGGGYVDSSNSQRGGNGKLQGTVVVKVLPENLDAFLLKLRPLGEIKNQSISTQDVTKDYYDTQARLGNSQRMEQQLQLLLQHTNGKVSDLLEVERELGRVRGEIEQAQGQLKLYDFQVQYATITIAMAEKDLNKAAAYLLQEHDQFSLFVHDVEDSFTQAKAAADTFKAQILNANLQHDSGNSISATMAFSVPPDQIDGFLDRVKSLGRVDNFTRTTQRVANDGGDPDQPADETRTEKDAVQVQLSIRADDESPRQQTQLAIASTGDIDAQAQQIKDDAVKNGAAVVASNFQRAPDGTETATISFRLALSKVADQMGTLEKLGRVESLTVQRNDRPGQAAADPSAPAEIDLTLHNVPAIRFEDEQPRQATQLAIASTGDVDAQALQVKNDALKAGMAVTASTFERQPDGTEQAAMTFRLPMTQAADFTATLEKLGKVESLAVQRNDVVGPNSTDPNAPAEISLTLHNERAVVADDRGFWTTVRHTFGGGIEAFLTSVQTIGVLVAFLAPWLVVLAGVAWLGRRIYVARRTRA